ncbi:MAG: alpha/beta hydrolase family protein [Pseudonocardiaceae bacterium]
MEPLLRWRPSSPTPLGTRPLKLRLFQRHHADHLVGPWPEAAHLYRQRSPVHNADQITQPVLVIHGLNDYVVPAEQAEATVAALRQRAVPVTELAFLRRGPRSTPHRQHPARTRS